MAIYIHHDKIVSDKHLYGMCVPYGIKLFETVSDKNDVRFWCCCWLVVDFH